MDSISEDVLKGTSSDINGYFIVTGLTSNEYTLHISIIGFQIYKQKIIVNDENVRVDISLTPQPISLDEVSVSSERTGFEEKVEVSRINISAEEIKMIPAFVESDVFRSQQYFPSVTSANDFNASSSCLISR